MTKNPRGVVFILFATALLVAGIGLSVGFRSGELNVPWRERVPEHEFPRALGEQQEPQADSAAPLPESG